MVGAKKTRTAHITATTAIVNFLLLLSLELFKSFPPLVGSVSSAASVGSFSSDVGFVADAVKGLDNGLVIVEVVVFFVVATVDVVVFFVVATVDVVVFFVVATVDVVVFFVVATVDVALVIVAVDVGRLMVTES